MRYNVSIVSLAELDIQEIKKYYKSELDGLEIDFQKELDAKVKYLKRDAQTIQIRYDDIRISFLNRFPYGIHFQLYGNNVLILGIYAMKDSPKKWRF